MPDSKTPTEIVDRLRDRGIHLKRKGVEWAGPCWKCGGKDRFHVREGATAAALTGCRGCSVDHAETMRELFPSEPGRTWEYEWTCTGPDGSRVHQRNGSGPGKVIRWGAGELGSKRMVYRTGRRDSAIALVVEGEKAADAAARLFPDWRIIGTCQGAPTFPDADVLDWALAAVRTVHLWPDVDEPGAEQMRRIALHIEGRDVRTVDPAALGLTAKGDDAADWRPAKDVDVAAALAAASRSERRVFMIPAVEVDLTLPAVEWLWDNRIRRGRLNAITGHGEAGKGLVAAAVVAGLSTGAALPGDDPRAPLSWAWVSSIDEDGHRVATARLAAAGADLTRGFVFPCDDIEDHVTLAALAQECADKALDFTVWDSHASWFVETVNGPAIRGEIRAAFAPLIRANLTPVLLAHFRKSDVGDGSPGHARVAGNASGIVGAARCVLAVEKVAQGDHVLMVEKGNDGPRPDDLHFTVEQSGLPYLQPVLMWTGSTAPVTDSSGPSGRGGSPIPTDEQIIEAVDEAAEPPTKNAIKVSLFGGIGTAKTRPNCSSKRAAAVGRRVDVLAQKDVLGTVERRVNGQARTCYTVRHEAHEAHEADTAASQSAQSMKHEAPEYVRGASCCSPRHEAALPEPDASSPLFALEVILAGDVQDDVPADAVQRLRRAWRDASADGRERAGGIIARFEETVIAHLAGRPVRLDDGAVRFAAQPSVETLEAVLIDSRWKEELRRTA